MNDIEADPIARFHAEFLRAKGVETIDVTAMALATATPDGSPNVRYVLLKEADARGFVFFTNGESQKGNELAANPHAALGFLWPTIYVQVRVQGAVEVLPSDESDAYFASRPRGSQIGAWASAQSRPIASRAELERRVEEVTSAYEGREIPRPAYWGGYRVVPSRIEFWYGRESRLHDRIVYWRDDATWRVGYLSP